MRSNAIRVDGLAELQRAFGAADKALRQDLKDALEEAAAPVRSDAQTLAGTIPRMQITSVSNWTRMRTGSLQSAVYIVPAERGSSSRGNPRLRRRRFKNVLGPRMDLALERNRGRVVDRLDQMLGEVGKVWDRSGLH